MDELVGRLLEFVSGSPRNASAELNTFLDLLLEYERGRQQWVCLLFSGMRVGGLCATVLKRYIDRLLAEEYGRRVSADTLKVGGLGDPEKLTDGLANLFKSVTAIVRQYRGAPCSSMRREGGLRRL